MILVTGASGHIGNVLVRLLYERGRRDLRLLVHSSEVPYLEPYAKEIVRGDIRDAAAVSAAVAGCSDVFHLAGMIQISAGYKSQLGQVNVQGTRNVLRACLEQGVKRAVYVSSIEALKTTGCKVIDETIELNPRAMKNDYGRSKMMGTVEAFNAFQKGLDVVIVYPTSVIGPYDYRGSLAGGMLKKYIGVKKPQPCFEGGFDFVDVRDVADGIYRAWQHGEKGQGYILAGGYARIGDLIGAMGEYSGSPVKLTMFPVELVRLGMMLAPVYYRLAGKPPVFTREAMALLCANVRVSNEKARKQLGYCARPISDTMRDIVKWHQSGEAAPDSGNSGAI